MITSISGEHGLKIGGANITFVAKHAHETTGKVSVVYRRLGYGVRMSTPAAGVPGYPVSVFR